ncbi:homoserine O-acetyltransferase family protein [Chitinophagaceae bacterium MMS25-I14]
MMQQFVSNEPFKLENGAMLPAITIAYCTYGKLNEAKDNVIWICHALTANADVMHWWPGIVGEGCVINPEEHFIVCANILGSCYGTTGPLSNNPIARQPYYHTFPQITIRDMIRAHIILRKHLQIEHIKLLVGGSMGGYQVQEWALKEPEVIGKLFMLATSPAESAWGIAIHATQRLAIEADGTWPQNTPEAGSKGLKAARGIGMLAYRNYRQMVALQTDSDKNKLDDYKAASYIKYQGDKLAARFNAFSYWYLTKAMDSHNIARKFSPDLETALHKLNHPTLLIGISSDMLCPVEEQRFMAQHMPDCTYVEIDSPYGHDGFLIEAEEISQQLREWMDGSK